MTTCVIVATIVGIWCAQGAEPVGQCRTTWYGQECTVDELPLFLSTYDPAICDEHPTNCSDPAAPWHGAVRRLSPDDYGRVAACPIDWLFETVVIPDIPLTVQCVDTGGRIHPMYRKVWDFSGPPELVWRWVTVIDVLWNHDQGWPWWSLRSWAHE